MIRIGRLLALCGLVVAIALAVAGCGKQASETGAGEGKELITAMVPCGQVGPFSEVEKLFLKEYPDVQVEWVPENMVPIVKKIMDGKEKPDVVMTMGDLEIDKLEKGGFLVEGTRTQYAENALALTVPKNNPAGVMRIQDLVKPSVKRIAVPDPELNSVGMHAIEALKGAGIWDKVAKKVILPMFAADGKDVVASGEVQASIGYYPCVQEVHVKGEAPAKSKKIDLVGIVPADLYQPFGCEAGVVKGCQNPEGGKKLVEFLKRPESQEIFRQWNFVSR